MTTVAERFAAAVNGVRGQEPPAGVRRVVSDLLLDCAGLCVAARETDYVRAAVQSVDAGGPCTAIGHRGGFDAAGAALINGIAAHGEDYDDTFEGGPVHAGAVIVPAVLAIAERFDATAGDALAGIAIGAETMCRLSTVAPTRVHRAGFHPTAVFGTLGAAAAAAVTLRLSERQLVDALGIAASMAGGIIEYLAEGAWTKRLHAGWAAQAGLRAALLARGGFVGPRTVFEGTHGLFVAFAHATELDFGPLLEDLGNRWVIETLAFKPYPCGTMIHPYIDCAIRLAARGVPGDAIESIECETAEGIVHRLWEPLADKQAPPNPYAVKFSVPFCVALGFARGSVGLGDFTDAVVADPRIRALAAKVRYEIDPHNPYPREFTGHLRATLRDGTVLEERQPYFRGGANEPLGRAELDAKFAANARYGGWDAARAAGASDALRALVAPERDRTALDLAFLRG